MKIISDRVSISKTDGITSVVILGKITRWKESLLLFWLLAWTFSGSVFIYYYLFPTPYQHSFVMLIFMMFWLYFELKIGRAFLWRKMGFEHLTFKNGYLYIKNDIKGLGKSESFDISNIGQIEKIEQSKKNFFAFLDQSFWVVGGEKIFFKYTGREIIFGKQINSKEQEALIQILNGMLKKEKARLKKHKT